MANGRIDNRIMARQMIDYSNLHIGNCYPTDLDGMIDCHNNCLVVMEYKYKSKELPRGQRIALQRLCDNSKIPALLIVAEHTIGDADTDVPADVCPVRKYYYNGRWYPGNEITVKHLMDVFVNKFDK